MCGARTKPSRPLTEDRKKVLDRFTRQKIEPSLQKFKAIFAGGGDIAALVTELEQEWHSNPYNSKNPAASALLSWGLLRLDISYRASETKEEEAFLDEHPLIKEVEELHERLLSCLRKQYLSQLAEQSKQIAGFLHAQQPTGIRFREFL
jgi:hypothetical protein